MNASTEPKSREAVSNVIRDTPGRLLMAWALLFSSLVLLSWRIHVHRAEYDWLEYPTALGDDDYYRLENGLGLGENDFFAANLKFTLGDEQVVLFRRLHEPTRRKDVSMRKVAREATGRFYVYTDAVEKEGGVRFYLKTGEDQYVTFGERTFYPTFEQTRQHEVR
jgi:hypothetical protein